VTDIKLTQEINMGYFKDLEIEIREMDFKGYTPQRIADAVGLSVAQIVELLESDFDEDPQEYAEQAADLDANFYGNIQ
jgi:hypothetical protein